MIQNMFTNNLIKCNFIEFSLCCIGIVASLYAYYVETSKEHDHNFEASCDINEWISCSKVFTSKYGKGFGLVADYFGEDHFLNQPNSLFGIIHYSGIILIGFLWPIDSLTYRLFVTFISNVMSIYLAYILVYILHDLCIVCVTTYIVNLLLFLCVLLTSRISKESTGSKMKKLKPR